MKTKLYSSHYSLEERMVEPFRAIRWIALPKRTISSGVIGLLTFAVIWWLVRDFIFQFWANELNFLLQFVNEPWTVGTGYWPDRDSSLMLLPKLTAGILPPFKTTWWSFTAGSICVWILSGYFKPSYLPLKAVTRFIIFLVWISLACFAISPLFFHHSVEEWSKMYFLGAYGSFLIYAIIWTLGILWFPIPARTKFLVTFTLIAFELLAIPLLLLMSTIVLRESSLLLLPLFALLIAPLTQLGWFVSFYSLALSAGADPSREVRA